MKALHTILTSTGMLPESSSDDIDSLPVLSSSYELSTALRKGTYRSFAVETGIAHWHR